MLHTRQVAADVNSKRHWELCDPALPTALPSAANIHNDFKDVNEVMHYMFMSACPMTLYSDQRIGSADGAAVIEELIGAPFLPHWTHKLRASDLKNVRLGCFEWIRVLSLTFSTLNNSSFVDKSINFCHGNCRNANCSRPQLRSSGRSPVPKQQAGEA